jgi:hypothetical protein
LVNEYLGTQGWCTEVARTVRSYNGVEVRAIGGIIIYEVIF